ncbi:MAG TPA: hypothetical protein DD671_14335, partial [Balneolaceae bacterium]|nr:hypothetical protein [Balneolaceae bacterium]
PAGVRVPVTATDENGNTSSGFARLDFNVVDLQLPTPVASDDITYTHVDNDNGDSRDNNGTINSGEYVRITVDVSDNPDFDNP